MKKALSISIGSSVRDKSVSIKLLGQDVHIQRIGTNGDMKAARKMYRDFDGKVDAFVKAANFRPQMQVLN